MSDVVVSASANSSLVDNDNLNTPINRPATKQSSPFLRVQDYRRKLEIYKNEIYNLKMKFNMQRNEIIKKDKKITSLTNENMSLKRQNSELSLISSQFLSDDDKNTALLERNKDLEKEVQTLKAQLKLQSESVLALSNQCDVNKIEELERELEKERSIVSSLKNELHKTRSGKNYVDAEELQNLRNENFKLGNMLVEVERKYRDLMASNRSSAEIKKLQEIITSLEDDLIAKNNLLRDYEDKINNNDATGVVNLIKDSIRNIGDKYNIEGSSRIFVSSPVSDYINLLKSIDNELKSLQDLLAEKNITLNKKEEEISKLGKDINDLRLIISDKEKDTDIKKMELEIIDLKNNNADLANRLDNEKAKNQSINDELFQKKYEINEMKENYDKIKSLYDKINDDVNNYKQSIALLESNHLDDVLKTNNLTKEIAELKERLLAKDKEVETYKISSRESQERVDIIDKEKTNLELSSKLLRDKFEKLSQENEKLKKDISELQELRQQNNVLLEQYNIGIQSIKELKDKMNQSKQENDVLSDSSRQSIINVMEINSENQTLKQMNASLSNRSSKTKSITEHLSMESEQLEKIGDMSKSLDNSPDPSFKLNSTGSKMLVIDNTLQNQIQELKQQVEIYTETIDEYKTRILEMETKNAQQIKEYEDTIFELESALRKYDNNKTITELLAENTRNKELEAIQASPKKTRNTANSSLLDGSKISDSTSRIVSNASLLEENKRLRSIIEELEAGIVIDGSPHKYPTYMRLLDENKELKRRVNDKPIVQDSHRYQSSLDVKNLISENNDLYANNRELESKLDPLGRSCEKNLSSPSSNRKLIEENKELSAKNRELESQLYHAKMSSSGFDPFFNLKQMKDVIKNNQRLLMRNGELEDELDRLRLLQESGIMNKPEHKELLENNRKLQKKNRELEREMNELRSRQENDLLIQIGDMELAERNKSLLDRILELESELIQYRNRNRPINNSASVDDGDYVNMNDYDVIIRNNQRLQNKVRELEDIIETIKQRQSNIFTDDDLLNRTEYRELISSNQRLQSKIRELEDELERVESIQGKSANDTSKRDDREYNDILETNGILQNKVKILEEKLSSVNPGNRESDKSFSPDSSHYRDVVESNQKLRDKNRELEEELNRVESLCNRLSSENNKLYDNIKELQEEISNSKIAEREHLIDSDTTDKQKFEEMAGINRKLQDRIRELEAELSEYKSVKSGSNGSALGSNELNSEDGEFIHTYNAKRGIKDTKLQNSGLIDRSDSKETVEDVQKIQMRNTRNNEKLEGMTLSDSKDDLDKIHMRELIESNENLLRHNQELQEEIRSLKLKLDNGVVDSHEIVDDNTLVIELKNRIRELENENINMKSQLNNNVLDQNDIREIIINNQRLQNRNRELDEELRNLIAKDANSDIISKSQIREMIDNNQKLIHQNEIFQEKLDKIKPFTGSELFERSEFKEMQENNRELISTIRDLRAQIDALKSPESNSLMNIPEYRDLIKNNQRLQTNNMELENQIMELKAFQEDKVSYQSKINTLVDKNNLLSKQNKELERRVNDVADNRINKQELNDLKKSNQILLNKNRELEREIEELREIQARCSPEDLNIREAIFNNELLKKKNSELQTRIDELEKDIRDQEISYLRLQSELKNAKNSLKCFSAEHYSSPYTARNFDTTNSRSHNIVDISDKIYKPISTSDPIVDEPMFIKLIDENRKLVDEFNDLYNQLDTLRNQNSASKQVFQSENKSGKFDKQYSSDHNETHVGTENNYASTSKIISPVLSSLTPINSGVRQNNGNKQVFSDPNESSKNNRANNLELEEIIVNVNDSAMDDSLITLLNQLKKKYTNQIKVADKELKDLESLHNTPVLSDYNFKGLLEDNRSIQLQNREFEDEIIRLRFSHESNYNGTIDRNLFEEILDLQRRSRNIEDRIYRMKSSQSNDNLFMDDHHNSQDGLNHNHFNKNEKMTKFDKVSDSGIKDKDSQNLIAVNSKLHDRIKELERSLAAVKNDRAHNHISNSKKDDNIKDGFYKQIIEENKRLHIMNKELERSLAIAKNDKTYNHVNIDKKDDNIKDEYYKQIIEENKRLHIVNKELEDKMFNLTNDQYNKNVTKGSEYTSNLNGGKTVPVEGVFQSKNDSDELRKIDNMKYEELFGRYQRLVKQNKDLETENNMLKSVGTGSSKDPSRELEKLRGENIRLLTEITRLKDSMNTNCRNRGIDKFLEYVKDVILKYNNDLTGQYLDLMKMYEKYEEGLN